uniref:RanBP2-type domain-containing protein n=1 Tax=Kalanchoe fedtschenkoi TaxID=63787 RepID=A0A7N0VHF8_KALFE
MGGAARFVMLLTSPYPFLTPRPSFLLRLARNPRLLRSGLPLSALKYSTRPSISLTPLRATQSENYHSQSSAFKDDSFSDQFSGGSSGSASAPNWYHPWPEWSRFIDGVRQHGYYERVDYSAMDEDAWGFASADNFSSPEFLTAARACLHFARDRDNLLGYLSRSDIRVVIENGSAFLFRDAEKLRSRMKSFLGITDSSSVVELDKATLADLMKYLLSYANMRPVSSADGYHSNEQTVGSSVRNLLSELANLSFGARDTNTPGSMQNQYPNSYGQAPRPRGQQIEMKKGDWICPKCTFMNFARNMKCLECEEARPRRQLSNGEWECPQCDFFNYGRNTSCLRCDCKRPGELTISPAHPQSSRLNMSDSNIQLAANGEKVQRWPGKVSQLNNSSDPNSRIDDEFPEIMPLRKGVNRFVVSTRKTPLERRLSNAQSQRDLGNEDFSEGINKSNNYGHVPFVPLPPDMFSAKPQDNVNEMGRNNDSHISPGSRSPGSTFITNEPDAPSDKLHLSERPVSFKEGRDYDEQAEKSERWFKRVAELHDVTDLASAIPDEDFPEIMPMRKGENRFVVSKKKDRSLTTPMHKRRASMEQASESKFVPFVPFPPDYFAKKNQSQNDVESSQNSTNDAHNSYNYSTNVNDKNSFGDTKPNADAGSRSSGPQKSVQSGGTTNIVNNEYTWSSVKISVDGMQDCCDGYSGRSVSSQIDSTGNSSGDCQKENTTVKDGWSGKSLEGSAVKEPDPLDMSEEAKAERWFRRAAQIKDISELSQIPDEDFPSIMPMRKGVNRFVVSKRKTPLERRLTSPQYRRNLPVVDSDPSKTINESK